MDRKQVFTQFLMVAGGLITSVTGVFTAFIPRLAWVDICYNRWEDIWFVGYYSPTPQLHDLTPGMLISVIGSILILLVLVSRNARLIPLSLIGNGLGISGTLGFLCHFGFPRGTFGFVSCDRTTWIGFYVTLIGVMLLLIGSFFLYDLKYRFTLLGVPLLLMFYWIYLMIIITNNLPYFSTLRSNAVQSFMMVILFLVGYGLLAFGTISNFRFQSQTCPRRNALSKNELVNVAH